MRDRWNGLPAAVTSTVEAIAGVCLKTLVAVLLVCFGLAIGWPGDPAMAVLAGCFGAGLTLLGVHKIEAVVILALGIVPIGAFGFAFPTQGSWVVPSALFAGAFFAGWLLAVTWTHGRAGEDDREFHRA